MDPWRDFFRVIMLFGVSLNVFIVIYLLRAHRSNVDRIKQLLDTIRLLLDTSKNLESQCKMLERSNEIVSRLEGHLAQRNLQLQRNTDELEHHNDLLGVIHNTLLRLHSGGEDPNSPTSRNRRVECIDDWRSAELKHEERKNKRQATLKQSKAAQP